ncbi:hypothetical protein J6590_037215 [Homalodisca vitripennis]|nr:hypothetical protein J6590_037215 [Homalodisca vitripennis]
MVVQCHRCSNQKSSYLLKRVHSPKNRAEVSADVGQYSDRTVLPRSADYKRFSTLVRFASSTSDNNVFTARLI